MGVTLLLIVTAVMGMAMSTAAPLLVPPSHNSLLGEGDYDYRRGGWVAPIQGSKCRSLSQTEEFLNHVYVKIHVTSKMVFFHLTNC